jgi:hypothetical protein
VAGLLPTFRFRARGPSCTRQHTYAFCVNFEMVMDVPFIRGRDPKKQRTMTPDIGNHFIGVARRVGIAEEVGAVTR